MLLVSGDELKATVSAHSFPHHTRVLTLIDVEVKILVLELDGLLGCICLYHLVEY